MTITTSLTKTGRASNPLWMLSWLEESTSVPGGRHHAAETTSLTSSGDNNRTSSGDNNRASSGTNSMGNSGVGGGKVVHPSGAPWLSRG